MNRLLVVAALAFAAAHGSDVRLSELLSESGMSADMDMAPVEMPPMDGMDMGSPMEYNGEGAPMDDSAPVEWPPMDGTDAPDTPSPMTMAPMTDAPMTDAPMTNAPMTKAPMTDAPMTKAPATRAPDTIAPTPAPPSSLMTSSCSSNSDCTRFGDSGATCISGTCACTSGFSSPTNSQGFVVPTCMQTGVDLASVTMRLRFHLHFRHGNYGSWISNLSFNLLHFENILDDVGFPLFGGLISTEGSVLLSGASDVSADAVSDNTASNLLSSISAAVAADTSLTSVLGSELDVTVLTTTSSCELTVGADYMVELLNGTCVPSACALGYTYYDMVCYPVSDSDDDGLSSGAIAGIVIGCIAAVAIIVGGAFFFARKKQEPVRQINA